MLNKNKHQLIMGRILHDLYTNISLAPLLGFKGGTCAYFFYDLPRFSVDLDFDALSQSPEKTQHIFASTKNIIQKHGTIKDEKVKHFTIFFLLSYGQADHNIKIEISARKDMPKLREHFELKEYLGLNMLAAKSSYLFASKLVALTMRTETAMRDIYDIWYFAKNNWEIDEDVIKIQTGKSLTNYLTDCINTIDQVKTNNILHGIGELIDDPQKSWVKENLKEETLFLLKNYQSALR